MLKLLKESKSGFEITINWNKYQSTESLNEYLNYLIDSSFQGVNRLFVLSFENDAVRKVYKGRFSFKSRNKRLKCYDRWRKHF